MAGNGEDFAGGEGDIEARGDGRTSVQDVQNGLVTSLNSDDGSSSSQEDWVADETSSTEVSCDTEVLDDTSDGGHGGDISQHGVEVELTVGDGLTTLVDDGLLRERRA